MKDAKKLLQAVARDCPLAYQQFFGRRYLLPHYRQADYGNQEFEALISFDRILQFAVGVLNPKDEVLRAALACTLASLHYKRPTLFLEKELGEAFMRAPLPGDWTTGDIKWRWDAFKVWLPLGLITIEREDGIHSLTHFDICKIGPTNGIHAPREIAREVGAFGAKLHRIPNPRLMEKYDFLYKENGVCISSALDKGEYSEISQTVYGLTKPWGTFRISDYHALEGDLKSPVETDKVDKQLLNRLEHLVLQVLLYLGAVPFEYEGQTRMVRPMKREGKNLHPGLFDAHFVGQSQLRPYKPSEPKAPMVASGSTGRHLPAHWVAGHWKRVVYGSGGSERRLQWINTYTTYDQEKEEELSTKS